MSHSNSSNGPDVGKVASTGFKLLGKIMSEFILYLERVPQHLGKQYTWYRNVLQSGVGWLKSINHPFLQFLGSIIIIPGLAALAVFLIFWILIRSLVKKQAPHH